MIHRHVDKGGNPELYTQRCLQESLEKCSDMKAKQKAYKVCAITLFQWCTVFVVDYLKLPLLPGICL